MYIYIEKHKIQRARMKVNNQEKVLINQQNWENFNKKAHQLAGLAGDKFRYSTKEFQQSQAGRWQ